MAPVKEGKVVTVFSAKGGVGKTTLATNLAVHLANSGVKTLLVDLDLAFGDVAISLQLMPTKSIYDAVAMSGAPRCGGCRGHRHHSRGQRPRRGLCAQRPGRRRPHPGQRRQRAASRSLGSSYDYVIVDTPPSFTEHVLAACDLSDALVLIATLDIPAVKNLRVAIDTLDMLGSPKDARIIVLNRADAKVGLRPEDVVAAIKAPIAVSIPNSLTVPASVNRGVPIVLDDPRGPVSAAIRELADVHIRQRFGDAVDSGSPRKSLFRGRR